MLEALAALASALPAPHQQQLLQRLFSALPPSERHSHLARSALACWTPDKAEEKRRINFSSAKPIASPTIKLGGSRGAKKGGFSSVRDDDW